MVSALAATVRTPGPRTEAADAPCSVNIFVILPLGSRGKPAQDEFLHNSGEHALSCPDGEVSEH
jgi:hypothetical protein